MFSTTSGAARTRVVYTIATSAGLITPEKDPSYSLRLSLRAADGPHVLRRIPVSQSLSKHAVQGAAATCADIAPPPIRRARISTERHSGPKINWAAAFADVSYFGLICLPSLPMYEEIK